MPPTPNPGASVSSPNGPVDADEHLPASSASREGGNPSALPASHACEYPADIMRAAEDALDNVLCHDIEAYGGSFEDARKAAIKEIAKAIADEREACAVRAEALSKAGREWVRDSIWATIKRDTAKDIRNGFRGKAA